MRCPQCQYENSGTAKFCEECGTLLEVAAERGLTPLVGRERDLAIFSELFRLETNR